MPRFNIVGLCRPDVDKATIEQCGGEMEVRCNCTASTEREACRIFLESAWWNGLLVSRFLSIKKRSIR